MKKHITQLKNGPLSTLFQQGQKRILVAEANGFGLHALIISKEDDKLLIEHSASSTNTDPVASIDEILQKLKNNGIQTPKEALLVSASVVPALLDIPVEGETTVDKSQMLELVRWEMETLMSEQASQWNIGWLLMGRNYLTEEQRDDILLEMEAYAEISANRGGRAPARFGEEAIKRDYVTREQLEECLAIQENMYLLDDAIDCSWLPESTTVGSQKGLWLCSAISAVLRQQWVAAFMQQQIRLQWVYPMSCTSSASLCCNIPEGENSNPGSQVLLEIQPGYIACCRIENQQITQFAQQKCCDRSVTASDIAELCQPLLSVDISSIWVSGQHPRIEMLTQTLTTTLNRPLLPVEPHQQAQCKINDTLNESLNLGLYSSIIGAAQHYFGTASSNTAIQLQGQPPPPPLYKQPKMQLYGVVTTLLFSVVCIEIFFAWQISDMEQQIFDNNAKTAQIEYINEGVISKSENAQKAKAKLDVLEQQHSRLQTRKLYIESVLVKRQQFAESLLPTIANNIPDQAIVYKIEENDWYRLSVSGWAATQSTVDDFNARLSSAIEPWNLYISDSPSEVKLGPSELEGYQFNFTLTPRESKDKNS